MHPLYCAGEDAWTVVRFAQNWEQGVMPEAGGLGEQAAWTVTAIEVVLRAWARLRDHKYRQD